MAFFNRTSSGRGDNGKPGDNGKTAPALPTTKSKKKLSEEERQDAIDLVEKFVQESDDYVDTYFDGRRTIREMWGMGGRRFVGDHLDDDYETCVQSGEIYQVVNLDQNGIINATAAQTQQNQSIKLGYVPGEERYFYCLKREAGERLQALIASGNVDPGDLTPAEIAGNDFLTELQYLRLQNSPLFVNPEMPTELDDYLLQEDDFYVIDQDKARDICQTDLDWHHDKSKLEALFRLNEQESNTHGHQPWVSQWNDKTQTWKHWNPDVANVGIDPNCSYPYDAEYFVITQVMSLDKAKTRFSKDLYSKLKLAASEGHMDVATTQSSHVTGSYQPKEGGSVAYFKSTTPGLDGKYEKLYFRREMVIIRTAWHCHEYPMTVGEAVRAGLVRQVPLDPDEAIAKGLVLSMDIEQPMVEDPDTLELMFQPPVTVMILAGSEDETEPGADNWPTKWVLVDEDSEPTDTEVTPPDDETSDTGGSKDWPRCDHWRQIKTLPQIREVLEITRCPYCYPPISWNINIPMPQSPYGMSEPHRTEDCQNFINEMAMGIVTHMKYNRYPLRVIPRSFWDYCEQSGVKPYLDPDDLIVLESEDFIEWSKGKNGFWQSPPPVDPTFPNLLVQWMSLHDRLTGNADVRQGRLPNDEEMSGEALKELSANAMGPVGYKAKFSEDALEHDAAMRVDAMYVRGFQTLRTWINRHKSYPKGVLKAVRMMAKEMEWTVEASNPAARGVNQKNKANEARSDYELGLLSKRDTLEAAGHKDPEAVVDRIRDEKKEDAKADYEAQQELREELASQLQQEQEQMAVQQQQQQPQPVAQPGMAM